MCMCVFDQDGFTHTVHLTFLSLSFLRPTSISYRIMILLTTVRLYNLIITHELKRFKYKHQCTNNPEGKMDLNEMAADQKEPS